MEEDTAIKIREIFSILSQGVEVDLLTINLHTRKHTKEKHILWLDADMYRLCIDKVRLNVKDRLAGIVPPGLYLRDISEIRPGGDSFHLIDNKYDIEGEDFCLSFIGSEKTYSIQFPSKFARDWFYLRSVLLVDDILSEDERIGRIYRLWGVSTEITQPELIQASSMMQLLQRGVRLKYHSLEGQILQAVLSYDRNDRQLLLSANIPSKSIFSWQSRQLEAKVDIDDISDIRVGCHSYGFVCTNSFNIDSSALSIISTSWVLSLQFVDKLTRDLFAERMFKFLVANRRKSQNEEEYLATLTA